MKRVLGAGIHLDIPEKLYFSDPCEAPSLTQSIANIICERSAKHAWFSHPKLNPDFDGNEPEPYNKSRAIGNAAHAVLLGRGKNVDVLDYEDFRSKAAQEARSAAENIGNVVILQKHYADASRLVAQVRAQIATVGGCEKAFTEGHGEVVIIAKDGDIWLRSMVDWMESETVLDDLKSTGMSAAPHGLGRMMADAGWDIQAAMQERILDILKPETAGRRKFRFFPIENEEPHAMSVAQLSESVMTMGRKKLDYAINVWRQCIATGVWPAYPSEIVKPDYPGFKETDWLNREIQYAEHNERQRSKRAPMLKSLSGG